MNTLQSEAVIALRWTDHLMFFLIYLHHTFVDCSVLLVVGGRRLMQLQHPTAERSIGEARIKKHYLVIIEGQERQNGSVTSRDAAECRPHVRCDSQLCCLLIKRRFSPRLIGYFCVLLLSAPPEERRDELCSDEGVQDAADLLNISSSDCFICYRK